VLAVAQEMIAVTGLPEFDARGKAPVTAHPECGAISNMLFLLWERAINLYS
jgi:hypothetical protein